MTLVTKASQAQEVDFQEIEEEVEAEMDRET